MKLVEYLLEGGTLFDVTYTWPEWLTSDIRTGVESLAMDYALRTIQPRVQLLAELTDNDLEEVIQLQVKNRILRNDYKYQTLLATEGFEYNPIENYNMVENLQGGSTKGQQINSTQYGQQQDELTHGHQLQRTHANSDTLTLNTTEGRQSAASISGSSGSTEGARSDSTTRSMYGYNSSSANPADSESFSKGAQENSATSSSTSDGSETIQNTGSETTAHTGTVTDANSGKDTTVRSQHTDQVTEGARSDTVGHELTRSGNIGVTTSQQMIISEREVANFSFLAVLTSDLVNSFCLGVM